MYAAASRIVPGSHQSRRSLIRRGLAAAAAVAAGSRLGILPVAAGTTHLIVDLGPGADGGDWSTARAVNGAGQIAWTWATAIDPDMGTIANPHPCIWEQGAVQDLSLIGLDHVFGIAADGTALGAMGPQPVRVLPGAASAEPLPGFGGADGAAAIAPAGAIAGTVNGAPVILRGAELTPLSVPEGFGFFEPLALNDAGQAAGVARIDPVPDRSQRAAIVSQDGDAIVLAAAPGGDTSAAAAINASGHVAGGPAGLGMHATPGAGRAFRYDLSTGETLDLGILPGYTHSRATGIDGAGRVIGVAWGATTDQPFQSAWVWDETSGMVDLNSLVPPGAGWLLSDAHGINDTGWIVGQGGFMGQRRGFLLVPVETA